MDSYSWHFTATPDTVFNNVGNFESKITLNTVRAISVLTSPFDKKGRRYYREIKNHTLTAWKRLHTPEDYVALNQLIDKYRL